MQLYPNKAGGKKTASWNEMEIKREKESMRKWVGTENRKKQILYQNNYVEIQFKKSSRYKPRLDLWIEGKSDTVM